MEQSMMAEFEVGRIDLGPTEPRHLTRTEQRMMDGALRRSLSIKSVPSNAWQLIETAPKDGRRVDLWFAIRGRVTDCYWSNESGQNIGWYFEGNRELLFIDDIPTHWMLVKPPA